MTAPSWPELAGRNAASTAIAFSGRMTTTDPDGAQTFDFWHAPVGRWRVESDGELLHVSDGDATFVRGRSGELTRLINRPSSFRVSWTGRGFGPFDLAGRDGLIHKMSGGVGVLAAPTPAIVGGREAWSTELGMADAPPRDRIRITIDSRTGLIVGFESARGGRIEVTGLSEQVIPDDVFVHTPGPAPAPEALTDDDRRRLVDRKRLLAAVDAGLARRDEVMSVVGAAPDVASGREAVARLLGVDSVGADAVLALQVRRFTVEERAKIARELADTAGFE